MNYGTHKVLEYDEVIKLAAIPMPEEYITWPKPEEWAWAIFLTAGGETALIRTKEVGGKMEASFEFYR